MIRCICTDLGARTIDVFLVVVVVVLFITHTDVL
jgi:hypothetical protein